MENTGRGAVEYSRMWKNYSPVGNNSVIMLEKGMRKIRPALRKETLQRKELSETNFKEIIFDRFYL